MANRIAGNALATRIQAIREDAGISILRLSEMTGIPNSTLRRKLLLAPDTFNVIELSLIADALDHEFEAGFIHARRPGALAG